MKNEIDKNYLIDRFLKGELTGLVLDEFKGRMRTDQEFALEVASQKAIIEGIKLARRQHLISILNGEKTPSSFSNINQAKEEKETVPHASIESPTEDLELKYNKYKINYNNWAYAALAVVSACFVMYAIFGYYIPHQKILMSLSDTLNKSEIVKNDQANDNLIEETPLIKTEKIKDSSNHIETNQTNGQNSIANNDSIKVIKDKMLMETLFSVASYETITPENTANGQVQVGDNNSAESPKAGLLRKTKGVTLKVEYWESVINFKGYKLKGSDLQLFDMDPQNNNGLKIIDQQLYLKKNDHFFKINATGKFENYQKVTDPALLKLLETN